jgi:2-polyprenyl-6-hydroxyphenyl methylase / 3-demethylubiquinone-9 3-methyltransferase
MENANTAAPRPAPQAAHFGAMADDWWNPKGSSAMLHRLNPVRLRYIRDQIDRHWQIDGSARHPLAGKRALDMGSAQDCSPSRSRDWAAT